MFHQAQGQEPGQRGVSVGIVGVQLTGQGRGGGCPSKPVAIVAKSSTVSLKTLTGHRLKIGAVITVKVSKSGMTSRTIKLTVRRGKDPKLS